MPHPCTVVEDALVHYHPDHETGGVDDAPALCQKSYAAEADPDVAVTCADCLTASGG